MIYLVLGLAITALLPDSLRWSLGFPLIGTVLVSLGIYLGIYGWLHYRLEPRFHFVDYVHADRP